MDLSGDSCKTDWRQEIVVHLKAPLYQAAKPIIYCYVVKI